jgi:multiple sugar transport system permease protein
MILRSAMARRNLVNGLLFISPYIVGFIVFVAFPVGASFYYGLTNLNILKPPQFVGLNNYQNLFFNDEKFWISLWNTAYYVLLSLPIGTAFTLSVAILLNSKVPGQSIFRTVYYLPSMVPAVASSIIWIMLLNPQFGIVNIIIRFLGLQAPGWIADPAWAKPAIILMGLWAMGGTIVIYLAALQDVPTHLVEAAILDGAGVMQRFFNVTIPMISPAILFNVIMGLIGAFQVFTSAYVMTGGGPNNSTLFYALNLYQNAFKYLKMGYASAMAWVLLAITLGCTLLVMRTSARYIYYGGEE